MQTKDVTILNKEIINPYAVKYSVKINNIEKFADIVFDFIIKHDSDKLEISIPDEILEMDNIGEIFADIERRWIEARYLDENHYSARCARIKIGKKYKTLVFRFPSSNIYVDNKNCFEYYKVVELRIFDNNDETIDYSIPIGFIRWTNK